jgi:hypothetical protein
VIIAAFHHPLCCPDRTQYEHCCFSNYSVLFGMVTVSSRRQERYLR